jgi:hypothetical protein
MAGVPDPQRGQVALGLIDALLTIAMTLCNAGVPTRDALADAFEETLRQQTEAGEPESRRAAAWSIGQFLRLLVRGERRFCLIRWRPASGRRRGLPRRSLR